LAELVEALCFLSSKLLEEDGEMGFDRLSQAGR